MNRNTIPEADFIPPMKGYSGQGAFRFWCQTVLPLVYDDSLSYYELLNKVVHYLNNTISDVANMEDNVQGLYDAYVSLQNYVNDYFTNLDVQEEINNKLDTMAENGTLSALIEPFLPNIITTWLDEHITPTTPIVDDTLSVSGAAADSKTVGDDFKQTLMVRGTLTDADDLNNLSQPGLYFCDTDSFPANTPTATQGRLLVIKTNASTFYNVAQLYFTRDSQITSQIFYRVSKAAASASDAWSNVHWREVVNTLQLRDLEESSMHYIGSISDEDDLDDYTDIGTYVIYADTQPANAPFTGRATLVVFNSNATVMQMYYSLRMEKVWIRYGHGVPINSFGPWLELTTNNFVNSISDDTLSIPLVRAGMTTDGKYARVDLARIRPVNSYRNVTNFHLSASYEIKFYYYTAPYDWNVASQDETPPFTYSSGWQTLDNYVTPILGTWFVPMIRKVANTNFTNEQLAYVQQHLTYSRILDADEPTYQTRTIPYDATTYHNMWNEILDSAVCKRVNMGSVTYDNVDYPMYMYELHPQSDYITSGYSDVTYDGTNALFPKKKALIIAGQHGYEKNTPTDVFMLAKEILNGKLKALGAMYDWYIIPLMNPWGYSHCKIKDGHVVYTDGGTYDEIVNTTWEYNGGMRRNGAGYDINRDYSDATYEHTDGLTYGFQTQELQVCSDYIRGTALNPVKWDIVIDFHQNHNDRYSTDPDIVTSFIGQALRTSSADNTALMNKIYTLISNVCAKVDKTLKTTFRRAATFQTTRPWQAGTGCTARNYFGGYASGGVGNTEHQSIAADYSLAAETSEVAYKYSQLVEYWYNPIACTVSTETTVALVEELLKAI